LEKAKQNKCWNEAYWGSPILHSKEVLLLLVGRSEQINYSGHFLSFQLQLLPAGHWSRVHHWKTWSSISRKNWMSEPVFFSQWTFIPMHDIIHLHYYYPFVSLHRLEKNNWHSLLWKKQVTTRKFYRKKISFKLSWLRQPRLHPWGL